LSYKWQQARGSIFDEHVNPEAKIDVGKLKNIQRGTATLTLPFAAAGVETVSASVTFPKAFPTGVVPIVIYSPKTIQPITTRVTGESNTGFTIEASDNVGTDLTASVTVEIAWVAVAP